MQSYPNPQDLVLVAFIPTPADMEIARVNERPASGIAVSLSPGADALKTAKLVKTRMEELSQSMPVV